MKIMLKTLKYFMYRVQRKLLLIALCKFDVILTVHRR